MIVIIQETFGTYFLNGEYETIYNATTKDFQNLISLEQFRKLGHSLTMGWKIGVLK